MTANERSSPDDRRRSVRGAVRHGRRRPPRLARRRPRRHPRAGSAAHLRRPGARCGAGLRARPAQRTTCPPVHDRLDTSGRRTVHRRLVRRRALAATRPDHGGHCPRDRGRRHHVAARGHDRQHLGGHADPAARQRRPAAAVARNAGRRVHRGAIDRDHHGDRASRQLHLPRRPDEPLCRRPAVGGLRRRIGIRPGRTGRRAAPRPGVRPHAGHLHAGRVAVVVHGGAEPAAARRAAAGAEALAVGGRGGGHRQQQRDHAARAA